MFTIMSIKALFEDFDLPSLVLFVCFLPIVLIMDMIFLGLIVFLWQSFIGIFV